MDSEELAALEILGGSLSMLISTILQQHYLSAIRTSTKVTSSLFVPDESPLGFVTYWNEAGPELAKLIQCDGLALLSRDRLQTVGECMLESPTRQLAACLNADFLKEKDPTIPIALDSIHSTYPDIECGEIAGLLAIPNPAPSYSYLLFFRKEVSRKIKWAGEPSKDIEKLDQGFRLNPRASFASYIESSAKKSDPFDEGDLNMAKGLMEAFTELASRAKAQHDNRERMGLVIRELNHRVRNTLAMVSSIVSQSRNSPHSIEEYLDLLENRIQTLSETQKLLTEYEWQPIEIGALFQRVQNIYSEFAQRCHIIQGTPHSLPSNLASLLALVLNELFSNAIKYGALSNSSGRVRLRWETTETDLFIHWQETGGPTVTQPTRSGFGTSLIEEALTYEFDARCEINYADKGLEVHFWIPLTNIQVYQVPSQDFITRNTETTIQISPNFVALVLEDDYLIAKELRQMLQELGAVKVDTFGSIDRAISAIQDQEYDIAILDVNIRGKFSIEVANLLRRKEIPFAFATGYGSKIQELKALGAIAVLSKPVHKMQVKDVIKAANI